MNKSLEGKAALVTGAAGAIGSDAVRVLLDRGARVCAVDADKHGLELLKSLRGEGDRLVVHCGDVTDETHVRSFVKHCLLLIGHVHIKRRSRYNARCPCTLCIVSRYGSEPRLVVVLI